MSARTPRSKLQRRPSDGGANGAPTPAADSAAEPGGGTVQAPRRRRGRSSRNSLRVLVGSIIAITQALGWATSTPWAPSAATLVVSTAMYAGHFKGIDPPPTHLTRRCCGGLLPAGMLRMHTVTLTLIVWAWCIGTVTLAAARRIAEGALAGSLSPSWGAEVVRWLLRPAHAHLFVFAPAVLLVGGGASFGPLRGTLFRTFYDPPVFAAVFFYHYVVGVKLNQLATRMGDAAGEARAGDSPPPQARLWLGALPFASDVPELKAHGVRAVINMCDEWPGPAAAYREAGIEQLRLRTIDGSSPTAESIAAGVAFARRHLEAAPLADGRDAVFVHCRCGMGRSATVMLACLVACGGEEPEVSLRRMKHRRPEVSGTVAHAASFEAWLRNHRHFGGGNDGGVDAATGGGGTKRA